MASKKEYKEIKEYLNNAYSTSDVIKGTKYWVKYLLTKCQNLFVYENLPETLPAWEMEKSILIKGSGAVIKKQGKLYVPFAGNVYGFDEYMVPNKFVFANPVLGSGNYIDYNNCAIIWNSEIDKIEYNTSWLFECINRYARMLADLESTYTSILLSQRAGMLGSAVDSHSAVAMDEAITRLQSGELKTIVDPATNNLINGFVPFNFQPTGSIIDFSSARDYLLNCFYNEIGFQTLEEKKERMVVNELMVDKEILTNNIDVMFEMRKKNVEKINKVFGTNITVKKNELFNIEKEEKGVISNDSERMDESE